MNEDIDIKFLIGKLIIAGKCSNQVNIRRYSARINLIINSKKSYSKLLNEDVQLLYRLSRQPNITTDSIEFLSTFMNQLIKGR